VQFSTSRGTEIAADRSVVKTIKNGWCASTECETANREWSLWMVDGKTRRAATCKNTGPRVRDLTTDRQTHALFTSAAQSRMHRNRYNQIGKTLRKLPLIWKLCRTMQNLGLKTYILEKFGDKIKIWSTCNLIRCEKFSTVCQNSVQNFQCLSDKFNFLPGLLF